MTDHLPKDAPQELLDDLRTEVAQLRERVSKLEALLQSGSQSARDLPQSPEVLQSGDTSDASSIRLNPSATPSMSATAEPSLENMIGSQWLSRVGVVAVLVGVALFLKLAFDHHWIGSVARIVLGLAGGLAIYAGSEPFRRRGYAGFSSSLKGVGAGVLYLSLWASFSLYHLLPVVIAGLGMVAVTVGNGALAWKRNEWLLAVYAILGGLMTPFLLSNARSHEVALFAYLLLLSAGAGALTVLRGWNSLVLLAFAGSALYAIVWAFVWYRPDEFSITVVLAAAGFLLFAWIPLLSQSGSTTSMAQTALSIANAMGGVVLAIELYGGMARILAVLAIAGFLYGLIWLRSGWDKSLLPGWVLALDGNMALLVGVTLWIHRLWQGGASASGTHTGEQLSYSLWFMGLGAALVVLGFLRRRTGLRWQGLILLLASITKVFLVDMAFLSAGLRVVSFLGLGLLLLAVSFVYQRDWLKLRSKN